MESFETWIRLAEHLGIGATVVLGVVALKLWKKLEKEAEYSRERDKDINHIMITMTRIVEVITSSDEKLSDKLDGAMAELKISLNDLKMLMVTHGSKTAASRQLKP